MCFPATRASSAMAQSTATAHTLIAPSPSSTGSDGVHAPQRALQAIGAAFIESVSEGTPVQTAAVQMLQACAAAGLRPTPAMYQDVLIETSRVGPPEATLAWIARMRHEAVPLSTLACNISMRSHAATGNLPMAVQMLTRMMRQADKDATSAYPTTEESLPPPDEICEFARSPIRAHPRAHQRGHSRCRAPTYGQRSTLSSRPWQTRGNPQKRRRCSSR